MLVCYAYNFFGEVKNFLIRVFDLLLFSGIYISLYKSTLLNMYFLNIFSKTICLSIFLAMPFLVCVCY
jgi:hypothetical protein